MILGQLLIYKIIYKIIEVFYFLKYDYLKIRTKCVTNSSRVVLN